MNGTALVLLVLGLAAGTVLGLAIGVLTARSRSAAKLAGAAAQAGVLTSALEAERSASAERVTALQYALETERTGAMDRVAALQTALEAERKAAADRLALVQADEKRQHAVEELVRPMKDSLVRVAKQIEDAERSRLTAHGELAAQVKSMSTVGEQLRSETGRLVTALHRSEVRGRWGEMQLRRLVESAGLLPHVHFTEQETLRAPGGALRPDMVVHLAEDREVVVDAKVALDAFLEGSALDDAEQQQAAMQRHAAAVSAHVDRLSGKEYWRQFENTPEFVVMFLPAESLLGAALEQDPALLERAFSKQVVLATPATLLALLRTVALGWRHESVARNAREILELGRELHSRLATMGTHFAKLGSALDSAVGNYNKSIGSLESRVMVTARRMAECGVTDDEIAILAPVEKAPREITLDDQPADLRSVAL